MGIRYEDKTVEGRTFQGDWVPCPRTVREIFGPCLVCEQETRYAGENLDDAWLEKQFKRRTKLLNILRGRNRSSTPSVQYIEMIVCATCREDCRQVREAANQREYQREIAEEADQRAAEIAWREQREQAQAQREYHLAWREGTRGEFDRGKHSAEFRVSLPKARPYVIAFRWRATGGKCRGDSPRNIVGMWVDGKPAAHYEAWDLEPFWDGARDDDNDYQDWYSGADDDDDIDDDPEDYRSDLFAPGLGRWIEREFQALLVEVKPAAKWRIESLPLNLHSLNRLKGPCVIHTRWIDGSIYATLFFNKEDMDLPRLSGFVLKHLGLRIEQPSFRPLVKKRKKRRAAAH